MIALSKRTRRVGQLNVTSSPPSSATTMHSTYSPSASDVMRVALVCLATLRPVSSLLSGTSICHALLSNAAVGVPR